MSNSKDSSGASGSKGPVVDIKIGDGTDAGKFRKLAQRVQKTLTEEILFADPKQLDPKCILVSWLNRDGAPPNIPYLHHGLLKNYFLKGYDRTRPQIGICVKITSPEGRKRLLEHNRRFSKGSSLLPPIYEDQVVLYASLAFSHGNLSLRLIQANCKSPAGDLSKLLEDDPDLREVVTNGHKWWILPETVHKEKQVDISLWRNQDQNENQATHEIEILQTIVASAQEFGGKKIIMGDLVSKAQRRNPAKISPQVLLTLCKYFTQFLEEGEGHYVQELVDFHSSTVNPNELVVSNAFYQSLTSSPELQNKGPVRHYLLLTQYTDEKALATAAGPAKSNFLEPTVLTSLLKKTDKLKVLDQELRSLRENLLKLLEDLSSEKQARLDLAVLMDLVIRCLFPKAWSAACPFKVPESTGKFSVEKIKALAGHWAKWIEKSYPESDFCKKSGLILVEAEDAEDMNVEVDLQDMRTLKKNPSEPSADGVHKFSRGDQVTVIRRMSWLLDDSYRKDLVVGTEGVIEGWADLEQRQVLLKVPLKMPDKSLKEVTQSCYPRNLQLTREYQVAQVGNLGGKGNSKPKEDESSGSSGKKVPEWLVKEEGQNASNTRVQDKWDKLLADWDPLNKAFWLKSRIGICLETLAEQMPQYTPKDLVVCHRQNDKGAWRQEVWTFRAFEAFELQLAPLSSQLKDTHLMANANAVVGIPRHGPGAHPDGQSLALDGRTRNSIAAKGVIDATEHRGSLFWIVGRTSKASEANLTLESVAWEHKVTLVMPHKKRKLTTEWESKDLPTIPILVNKKPLKAHTRLVMFVAETKKEEKKS